MVIKADVCIIGAGSGGLSLAAGASQLGASVVLVERDKMGGDCLNTGCVPSKALLAAAKHHWQSLNNANLGLTIIKSKLDFTKVMLHVKETIKTIEPHDSVERFEALSCKVNLGHGKFVDKKTLQVGEQVIQASRFVIATGSSTLIPPIKGLANIPFYTNETIFNIETLPTHLIIIGGGPIACEIGMAFAMLGAKVSLIVRSKILSKDETDCVAIVRQSMLDKGINIFEQADTESLADLNHRTVAVINSKNKKHIITGSHIFIATGRTPNISELNLELAGIDSSAKGITVDDRLRTSNKKIFAIGDVIGQQQFTHVASAHAGVVLKNILFRWPAKMKTHYIPWVTYTTPELAHVGLTITQAKKQNIKAVITETEYKDNDRAIAINKTIGKIKILTDLKGRLLGVTIVGEQAGELIMPWLMMVKEKRSLRKITDLIVPYPTLSELNKKVAGQFYHKKLFSKNVKRIVRWLKC